MLGSAYTICLSSQIQIFLHNSLWINLHTQSCPLLDSFCAILLHWLITGLVVLSLSQHNRLLSLLLLLLLLLLLFHGCCLGGGFYLDQTDDFHWSLNDNKLSRVSKTLLMIRFRLCRGPVHQVSFNVFAECFKCFDYYWYPCYYTILYKCFSFLARSCYFTVFILLCLQV